MFALLLTILALLAVTVAIHALGTVYWIRHLGRHYVGADGQLKAHKALPALIWSAVGLLSLHIVEVLVWALTYLLVLPGDELTTFEEAVYFSVVTFATLGYGDVTLVDHEWRLLSGAEALNGVLLAGWSAVFQRSWKGLVHAGTR
jgi:voltage-gated potassium channel